MSPPKDRDLPPLQNSIALLSDYIAIRSTTLILVETSSGYDFDIIDRATGAILFTVKGFTNSQDATKEVFDIKGRQIFALRKKNSRYPTNHCLESPDGSTFMAVEWSWGSMSRLFPIYSAFPPHCLLLMPTSRSIIITDPPIATAEFTARFTNTVTQAPIEMSMNASYFRRNGDWKIDGQTVAHVFRDAWTAKDMWRGKRTYYLTIAPGMDMAVAVAACLYVHERVNEGSDNGDAGQWYRTNPA